MSSNYQPGAPGNLSNSRCVFVGNIPYDASEEKLVDIFGSVGTVVSFRLVHDKDSRKMKGYGFCEYKDQEHALSAMRNLNGRELNGRPLRVDFAENEKGNEYGMRKPSGRSDRDRDRDRDRERDERDRDRNSNNSSRSGMKRNHSTMNETDMNPNSQFSRGTPNVSNNPPINMGAATPEQQITTILRTMSTAQLYEIMGQMKILVQQSPENARQILVAHPQFAYALIQAQVILGIVNPQMLPGLIVPVNAPMAVPMMQPAGLPQNMAAVGMPRMVAQPTVPIQAPAAYPAGAGIAMGGVGYPGNSATASLELIAQIMSLTPAQIDSLGPLEQQQVRELQLQIRAAYPNQVFGL